MMQSKQKYEYSKVNELLAYLFDGQPHLLAGPVGTWLESSRRFNVFVTTFRDKIRKKLRVTQDKETLYDLQLELETAYLLLQERSLSLAYEPGQSRQIRSPDFAVNFTTSLTFMVEVTRLRAVRLSERSLPVPLEGERLADAICSKLGQLRPGLGNVLIVGVDSLSLTQSDLKSMMRQLQQRAERNDSTLLQRYRFRERTDFFNQYQRLSEVIVRGSQLHASEPMAVWVNPQGKYPLPGRVRTVLYRSHRPQ